MRRHLPLLTTLLTGVAVIAWTLWIPTALDRLWAWPYLPKGPFPGQLAEVWAQVSQPTVSYLAMIGLVVALFRCRWRDLAGSVLLAGILTVSSVTVLKSLVARPRPSTPWLGNLGADASFPSGHAAAATALAIAVVQVTWTLTGGRRPTVIATVGAVLTASAVAIGRLLLGVHHVSDVLGAALIACFAASLSALITGAWRTASTATQPKAIHVVWHPHRVRGLAGAQARLAREAAAHGCPPPVWLATERDGHGVAQARQAVLDGADLVIALGGDGTIRQVLTAVGTAADVAVLPAGSGNLLAKNLDIPLDLGRAIWLALDGQATPLDLMRVEFTDLDDAVAAVMVGAGADAAVLEDTSERAKRFGGPLAYLLAGRRHIGARPSAVTVTVDGTAHAFDASLVTVGNVGSLHPGIALMPSADPSDGRLEVLVASPRGAADVLKMMFDVLLVRDPIPRTARFSGSVVDLRFGIPTPFQVDGDVVGRIDEAKVAVLPGAARLVTRARGHR